MFCNTDQVLPVFTSALEFQDTTCGNVSVSVMGSLLSQVNFIAVYSFPACELTGDKYNNPL